MSVVPLETGRIILRAPVPEDAPAVQRMASDERVARMTASIPHPYPSGGAEQFIRGAIASTDRLHLAVVFRPTGEVVGMISSTPDNNTAELAYMIDPIFWGRGVATEAAILLVDHLFRSDQSLVAILAGTMPGNAGSRRVLEKVGFSVVGEHDRDLPVRGGSYRITHWSLTRERHIAHNAD